MTPFAAVMFPDTVTFFKAAHATGAIGGSKRTFPAEGVEMAASVQKSNVNRVDANGRTYTQTVHTVRTQEDPGADKGDKFEYRDHILTVEGHSEPGGIGDVIWITQCLETR